MFPKFPDLSSFILVLSMKPVAAMLQSRFLAGIVPLLIATFSASTPALAQITSAPDGTNTAVNQSGNSFNIGGGTQAGSNLFHSFQQFGLNAGQVATFLSNPAIQNILGRVAGGDASVIHGQIQVTGSNANLYLMNPAGIVFGASASLNVPGSFTATTANAIGLGTEQWFNAVGTNNYAALIGNPGSFAFLTRQLGGIVNAGNLAVGQAQSLTLLGGTVINTGTLTAPGGTVTIAAVAGEKLVRLSQSSSLLSLDLPLASDRPTPDAPLPTSLSLPQLLTGGTLTSATGLTVEDGVVKLTGAGVPIPTSAGVAIASNQIDVSGNQGGTVQILGDRVGVISATINASGINEGGTVLVGGDYQGRGSVPNAQQTYVSRDSVINADALQQGNGGKVIVWADGTTRFDGTITAKGGSQFGDGGLVEVSGKQTLSFDGSVDVTASTGKAGQLLLDPDVILIDALGTDDTQLDDGQILAGDGGAGTTFRISTTKLLQLLNGGNVTIAANTAIAVNQAVDANTNPNPGNLALTSVLININAPVSINGTLTLTGNVANNSDRVINLTSRGDLVIQGPVTVSDSIGFPATVKLTSTQGNIFVNTISSGSGGVDINAAGLFQARTGATRVNVFLRESPEGSSELANFLQSKGIALAPGQFVNVHYQNGGVNESLPVIFSIAAAQSNNAPAGSLNAPVTIRYGGATRTLVDSNFPIVSTDGFGTVTQGRILIQGGNAAFFLGPTVTGRLIPAINDVFLTKDGGGNFVPVDPATFNPATTTLYRNETYIASYPTIDFPTTISGLAGSIYVGFGTNTTLYGSSQSRVFPAVSPLPVEGGGSVATMPTTSAPASSAARVQVADGAIDPVQRGGERKSGEVYCVPTIASNEDAQNRSDRLERRNPCALDKDDDQILKILGDDSGDGKGAR
jgi:filamentous hemagglutinin family protein